jgi:hypothetical protein
MAIDTRRVILAAVEAAIDDISSAASKPAKATKKKAKGGESRKLPAGLAILLGAGVVTAARVAGGSRGRELLESAQQRLAEYVEDGAGQ